MKNKVFDTIKKHKLIHEGDYICVACSGGADSVALFDVLYKNKAELNIKELSVCHLNHCLRGSESDGDEAFTKELAKKYGVKIYTKRVEVNALSKNKGYSVELAAREARYSFFREINEELGAKIATAHTLSDCMETTIFNLARGSGLKGLTGIPPKRDYIIRPLIDITRENIIDYIKNENLSYVTDSTNAKDIYTRNRIRHNIIPRLYEINASTHKAFSRLYEQINAQNEYIEKIARAEMERIKQNGALKTKEFIKLDECIKTQILSILLNDMKINISNDRVMLLMGIIKSCGTTNLTDEYYFTADEEKFYIYAKEEGTEFFSEKIGNIIQGSSGSFAPYGLRKRRFYVVSCEQVENFIKKHDLDLKNLLSYDRIYGSMVVRQKMEGDKIRLNNSNCTKKMKKLFLERDIPKAKRKQLLMLCDDKRVLWAEDIGYSSEVAPSSTTRLYLAIIAED